MKRIILEILLFLFIVALPWWLSVPFALFILYYLKSFNEIILFGLIMDIFYGKVSPTFHILNYQFTLLFFVFLVSSFFIKVRLKFYS